jgi:hypothetical protein
MNTLKIPFKDTQVRFIFDSYHNGMCTYDEVKLAMKKIELERTQYLMDQGMEEEQAIDEAIDDLYALDYQELENVTNIIQF